MILRHSLTDLPSPAFQGRSKFPALAREVYSDHLLLRGRPRSHWRTAGIPFHRRDWTLAWSNFLLQECGPCRSAFPEEVSAEEWSACRFVYVLGSLRNRLNSRQKEVLLRFLESGGVLIADGLDARDLGFGVGRFRPGLLTLDTLTGFDSPLLPVPLRQQLLKMPFKTRGWIFEPGPGTVSLLEMNHHPVLFKQTLGQGCLFTFAFDLGLLLTGLQQGVPAKGKKALRKTFGTQKKVIEPEDLVLKKELLDNAVPWADLFEKMIWRGITSPAPAPRWWYFPFPYNGAVISTHDEEALGDDARLHSMNAKEAVLGVRSTFFIISDKNIEARWARNKNVLSRWQSGGGPEVGLHWNRFKRPRFKIRSRKFGMHEAPLAEQTAELAARTGEPVRLNRNHYLALGTHYGEHFERLAAAGIVYDATYGPNQGGRGYLFGTGYPFWGLNWQGENTGVLELPFLTQELWGGADFAFLTRLIEESASNYHQCVTLLFHPHYRVKDAEGRRVWLETLAFARKSGQWMPAMGEFFGFFVARSQSSLQSSFENGKLKVTGHAGYADAGVVLPLNCPEWGTLKSLRLDGKPCEGRTVQNGGDDEVIIAVGQNPFELEASYA